MPYRRTACIGSLGGAIVLGGVTTTQGDGKAARRGKGARESAFRSPHYQQQCGEVRATRLGQAENGNLMTTVD
jgi:hypothetical protein